MSSENPLWRKVAVGIIIQNSLVLVCQRKKSARYALKWEFPGGKFEPDESAEQCLHRELREELSIEATIGKKFHTQSWIYPDAGSFEVHYHLIPSFSGTMTNNVFEQIQWIAIRDLRSLDMLEGNKDVVALLVKQSQLI